MTVDTLFLARDVQSRPIFADLSMVEILVEATSDDDERIPAGSVGTVVSTLDDGKAYTVEFMQPEGALATLPGDQLKPADVA